jgi:outer membrane protease
MLILPGLCRPKGVHLKPLPTHRACAAALLLLLASFKAPAQGSSLTVTPFSGMRFGRAGEIVFSRSAATGLVYTKSRLDWEHMPLFTAGSRLDFAPPGGFTASVSASSSLPGRTGVVTDSDWLNYDFNGEGTLTNYSLHDCYAERALFLEARAGWALRLLDWLSVEPSAAMEWMSFKWTARDGALWSPPGWISGTAVLPYPAALSNTPISVAGTVIVYQQEWVIPSIGLEVRLGPDAGPQACLSFSWSPFMFCADLDNHEFSFITGGHATDYRDVLYGGMLLEPGVSFHFPMGERGRLALGASYRHIAGLVGDTTVINGGLGWTPGQAAAVYANSAGASYDELTITLGLRFGI